jgi:hypothetical protein
MNKVSSLRHVAVALGAGSLLVVTLAGAALASDSVTQSVTAGSKSASIADLTLTSVGYSNAARDITGSLILTVDDSTDSSLGWGVTIQVSAFVYAGTATGGANIPAANFAVTSAGTPVTVSGHAASSVAATGPEVATTFVPGSLASPRRTIEATAGYGQGTYTQALAVTLTIPGMSHVGTYTGTLTETFVAAP